MDYKIELTECIARGSVDDLLTLLSRKELSETDTSKKVLLAVVHALVSSPEKMNLLREKLKPYIIHMAECCVLNKIKDLSTLDIKWNTHHLTYLIKEGLAKKVEFLKKSVCLDTFYIVGKLFSLRKEDEEMRKHWEGGRIYTLVDSLLGEFEEEKCKIGSYYDRILKNAILSGNEEKMELCYTLSDDKKNVVRYVLQSGNLNTVDWMMRRTTLKRKDVDEMMSYISLEVFNHIQKRLNLDYGHYHEARESGNDEIADRILDILEKN